MQEISFLLTDITSIPNDAIWFSSSGSACLIIIPVWLKRQLYFTLVHSRLNYCSLVWGTCSQTCISKLLILQKKAVRSIANILYKEHSSPYFIKYSLPTVEQSLIQKLAIYVFYKIKAHPQFVHENYINNASIYSFRHTHYTQSRVRTNYGKQKIFNQIAQLLNNHPKILSMINNSNTIYTFKRTLKTYLSGIT